MGSLIIFLLKKKPRCYLARQQTPNNAKLGPARIPQAAPEPARRDPASRPEPLASDRRRPHRRSRASVQRRPREGARRRHPQQQRRHASPSDRLERVLLLLGGRACSIRWCFVRFFINICSCFAFLILASKTGRKLAAKTFSRPKFP